MPDAAELLTRFGLTRQEAAIYLLLLTEGNKTGYEVAKLTGISRSNAYTALAGLTEKGAACVAEDTATRYSPVPAEEFTQNFIHHLQNSREDLLNNLPEGGAQPEGYITIKGERHIIDKMRNMIHTAEQRVYLSTSQAITRLLLDELKPAISRGLKIVIITSPPFALEGATVHHTDKTPYQIRLITDSTSVLTGDISDGEYSTCLYSTKKNLVDLFKESLKNEITLIELTKGTQR